MGLAFPVFQGVQNQAKKTQAKNDLIQIVTAVNAFYTEYGRYPSTKTADAKLPGDEAQEDLMDALRAKGGSLNPRGIVFLSPPDAKRVQIHDPGLRTAHFSIRGGRRILFRSTPTTITTSRIRTIQTPAPVPRKFARE